MGEMLHHATGNTGRQRRLAILDAPKLGAQLDFWAILEQITEGARLQRGEEMVVVVEDGDHDRAGLGAGFRESADQFQAAGIGQAQIDQQQVDGLALQNLHGVGHAASLENSYAGIVFAQQFNKPGPHSGKVIDDQSALHGAHRLPFLILAPSRQCRHQPDTINSRP
jgi:hypothetical protein